jgi:hypothetical protein
MRVSRNVRLLCYQDAANQSDLAAGREVIE